MRKDLSSAVAAIVGSLPGFTLPFVAALVLSPRESDLLLLALSVAITQAIIVTSAAELTTVAEYGRMLGRGVEPAPAVLRAFRWRVLRFALLLTLLVTPVLAAAYAAGSAARTKFLALVGTVAATPVLAALVSSCPGNASPAAPRSCPIAVQAMRSLPHGLVAQAMSQGVTQLGPAVDRLFLSSSGVGYILQLRDRGPADVRRVPVLLADLHLPAGRFVGPVAEDGSERAGRLLRRDARKLGIAAAVLKTALDTALYLWLGPTVIMVATVVLGWVMAAVYLVLLRCVVPATIGQELAEERSASRT